jgi:D-alanyl-D-alanine carboxypeptidase (penicillin-binding protein 5/6)
MKKKYLIFFSGIVIVAIVSILMFTRLNHKDINLYSKGAIVLSLDKNQILYEKNMDGRLHPASMTKLMSMLLVFENIEKGSLSYDQYITVSEKNVSTAASRAGIRAGESLTVDSLLTCVFLPSGSDAVLALAEHLYGSEERFVEEMNKKAEKLGLKNTHFKNSVGLEQNGHYSSPHDMSVIAAELVTKYPEVYKYTSLASASIKHEDGSAFLLKNTNDMLGYEGVNGLKTGSSPNGGYSLTMTYNKNDKHLIFVVMGNEMPYFRKKDCMVLLEAFQ